MLIMLSLLSNGGDRCYDCVMAVQLTRQEEVAKDAANRRPRNGAQIVHRDCFPSGHQRATEIDELVLVVLLLLRLPHHHTASDPSQRSRSPTAGTPLERSEDWVSSNVGLVCGNYTDQKPETEGRALMLSGMAKPNQQSTTVPWSQVKAERVRARARAPLVT